VRIVWACTVSSSRDTATLMPRIGAVCNRLASLRCDTGFTSKSASLRRDTAKCSARCPQCSRTQARISEQSSILYT
jgi:hypothetical protein